MCHKARDVSGGGKMQRQKINGAGENLWIQNDTSVRPTRIRRSQIMHFPPPPFPCSLLFIFVVQNTSVAIVAADGATVTHPNMDARM